MISSPPKLTPLRIRLPYGSEDEFIEKYGGNLTRGGVFIATKAVKPEGTEISFEFVLGDGVRLMRGEGVIQKTQVEAEGQRAGMTVRFVRLDAPTKALIERVVERKSEEAKSAAPPGLVPKVKLAPSWELAPPAPPSEEENDSFPSAALNRFFGGETESQESFDDYARHAARTNKVAPIAPNEAFVPSALENAAAASPFVPSAGAAVVAGSGAVNQSDGANEISFIPSAGAAVVAGSGAEGHSDAANEIPPIRRAGEHPSDAAPPFIPSASAAVVAGAVAESNSDAANEIPPLRSAGEHPSDAAPPFIPSASAAVVEGPPPRDEAFIPSALERFSEEHERTAHPFIPSVIEGSPPSLEASPFVPSEGEHSSDAASPSVPSAGEAVVAGSPPAQTSADSATDVLPTSFAKELSDAVPAPFDSSFVGPQDDTSLPAETQSQPEAPASLATQSPETSASTETAHTLDSPPVEQPTTPTPSSFDPEQTLTDSPPPHISLVPPVRRRTLEIPITPAPEPTREPTVLGIDFGTDSIRVAVFENGSPRLLSLALESAPREHKRLLGQRSATTRAALAQLLGDARRIAELQLSHSIKGAVLCVPASFDEARRHELLLAAQDAQLPILRFLTEPAAVALAFGYGRGLARKRVLVCDLGASTYNVTVAELTGDDLEVVTSGGDAHLGGRDFDDRIATDLVRRLRERHGLEVEASTLLRSAEQLKTALSKNETATIPIGPTDAPVEHAIEMTRAELIELTKDLVERVLATTRTVLEAGRITPAGIDELLIVGAQTNSPFIQAKLEEALHRPARADLNADTAVANGAAVLAHALMQHEKGKPSLSLREVLTSPIAIAAQDGTTQRVLERNTHLPADKTITLNIQANQELTVVVVQGSLPQAAQNALIGTLTAKAQANGELHIRFALAADGRLEVSATGPLSTPASWSTEAKEWTALLAQAPMPMTPSQTARPSLLKNLKRLWTGRSS